MWNRSLLFTTRSYHQAAIYPRKPKDQTVWDRQALLEVMRSRGRRCDYNDRHGSRNVFVTGRLSSARTRCGQCLCPTAERRAFGRRPSLAPLWVCRRRLHPIFCVGRREVQWRICCRGISAAGRRVVCESDTFPKFIMVSSHAEITDMFTFVLTADGTSVDPRTRQGRILWLGVPGLITFRHLYRLVLLPHVAWRGGSAPCKHTHRLLSLMGRCANFRIQVSVAWRNRLSDAGGSSPYKAKWSRRGGVKEINSCWTCDLLETAQSLCDTPAFTDAWKHELQCLEVAGCVSWPVAHLVDKFAGKKTHDAHFPSRLHSDGADTRTETQVQSKHNKHTFHHLSFARIVGAGVRTRRLSITPYLHCCGA